MTKRHLAYLASGLLGLIPVTASAQPVNGLYVGAGVGANFRQDQTGRLDSNLVPSARPTRQSGFDLSFDTGIAALGSIGWGFGNGLRLEVEGNYRNNGAGKVTTPFYTTTLSGDVDTYGVMANALFDMNIGLPWIYPYLGGGVGYVWNNAGNIHPSCCSMPSLSGTTGNFAYQAIGGAAFPVAALPGLSITAEYRFLGTSGDTSYRLTGPRMYAPGAAPSPQLNTHFSATVKANEQFNHAVMLGVRYAFNTAPAAVLAAPPAATPATKSFLVFFDWDKSVLTDRARGIIQEAAQTAKTVQHTKIEVNGYADTSGSPQYNQGLSMRRAQTVAAELVRNGVPKQEIAIKAFGDTVLLVPTGPGVREPQNRRVEIIVR